MRNKQAVQPHVRAAMPWSWTLPLDLHSQTSSPGPMDCSPDRAASANSPVQQSDPGERNQHGSLAPAASSGSMEQDNRPSISSEGPAQQQAQATPGQLLYKTVAPVPWSWTLPLALSSPTRASLSLPPDVHTSSLGPGSKHVDEGRPNHASGTLETRDASRDQVQAMSMGDGPHRFMLGSSAPLPWSWTLPLALQSPSATPLRAPESTGQSSRRHRRSSVSSLEMDAMADGAGHAPSWVPRSGTAVLRFIQLEDLPKRLLLETDAPVPWSWTLPLALQSPERASSSPALVTAADASLATDAVEGANNATRTFTDEPPLLLQLKDASGDTTRIMQLVSDAELRYGTDRRFMAEVYLAAVTAHGRRADPPPDDLRDLCVKCMRTLCHVNPDQAREFHNGLRTCSVGKIEARLYEARASMEERHGNVAKAIKMLQEGLRLGAQPTIILRRVLARIEIAANAASGYSAESAAAQQPEQEAQQLRGTPPVSPTACSCTAAPAIGRRSLSSSPRTPRRSLIGAPSPTPGCRSSADQENRPEPTLPCAGCAEKEQALRELQLEVQRLREQLQQRDAGGPPESVQPSSSSSSCCPRCCRSAVGGAVHALMDGVLSALGDGHPWGNDAHAAARAGDWRDVADEIWELISRQDPGSAEATAAVAQLPSLVRLRGLLQEAAKTAAATAEAEARPAEAPAEAGGQKNTQPRAALVEIPWWTLQENSGGASATPKNGSKALHRPGHAAKLRGLLEPGGDRRALQERPFSFLR